MFLTAEERCTCVASTSECHVIQTDLNKDSEQGRTFFFFFATVITHLFLENLTIPLGPTEYTLIPQHRHLTCTGIRKSSPVCSCRTYVQGNTPTTFILVMNDPGANPFTDLEYKGTHLK